MPEPTPSQLKIDGILMVPEGFTTYEISNLWTWLDSILVEHNYKFDGTISPLNPDAESFMVEVQRNWLKDKENEILSLREAIEILENREEGNIKAYLELSDHLRQEKDRYDQLVKAHRLLTQVEHSTALSNIELQKVNVALRLRLEVKDSPIKAGLKRIWKWLYLNVV